MSVTAMLEMTDPFASVLGQGRGRGDVDRIDAENPSGVARDEAQLIAELPLTELLAELRQYRDTSAPLVRELRSRAAQMLADKTADDCLTSESLTARAKQGGLYVTHARRIWVSFGQAHLTDRPLTTDETANDWARTMCGLSLDPGRGERALRGAWNSAQAKHCEMCARHARQVPETSEPKTFDENGRPLMPPLLLADRQDAYEARVRELAHARIDELLTPGHYDAIYPGAVRALADALGDQASAERDAYLTDILGVPGVLLITDGGQERERLDNIKAEDWHEYARLCLTHENNFDTAWHLGHAEVLRRPARGY